MLKVILNTTLNYSKYVLRSFQATLNQLTTTFQRNFSNHNIPITVRLNTGCKSISSNEYYSPTDITGLSSKLPLQQCSTFHQSNLQNHHYYRSAHLYDLYYPFAGSPDNKHAHSRSNWFVTSENFFSPPSSPHDRHEPPFIRQIF